MSPHEHKSADSKERDMDIIIDAQDKYDSVMPMATTVMDLAQPFTSKILEMAQSSANPNIQATIKIVENCLSFGEGIPYIGPICSILSVTNYN
jgi:hypothetical protein